MDLLISLLVFDILSHFLRTHVFHPSLFFFFFFNDTATTEIYTLSLHDALPISAAPSPPSRARTRSPRSCRWWGPSSAWPPRSEEHTSELQSQSNLVCRLLLEKKKKHNSLLTI